MNFTALSFDQRFWIAQFQNAAPNLLAGLLMQACKHFIVLVSLSVARSCRWHCSWAIINWRRGTIWRSAAQHSCIAMRGSESGKRQGSCSSARNRSDGTVSKSSLCRTRPMSSFFLISDAIPRQSSFKMVPMTFEMVQWHLKTLLFT